MVDMVIRLTVLVVLGLAFANAVHALAVFVRLARHLAASSPHGGLAFWLPAFGSVRDARVWLLRWRGVLDSRDPALVAIRTDARTVLSRHLHLTVVSNTWAIALTAIAV